MVGWAAYTVRRSGILPGMSEPGRTRAGAPPDPEPPAVDPEVLADRITEDVIQQLYASRQDLAEVQELGLGDTADVDAVAEQLLGVIGHLREIALALRGHDAGATRIPLPAPDADAPGPAPPVAGEAATD